MVNVICEFKNPQCLCQWCEKPCNNRLTCYECKLSNKQEHDIFMCTGFVGTYPWGTHSDEIHRKALDLCNNRDEFLSCLNTPGEFEKHIKEKTKCGDEN